MAFIKGATTWEAVNVGEKLGKMAGLGLGVEVLKFKDIKSLYVPVYADFRYLFAPSKGSQVFIMAQPGYGFYNSSESVLVAPPGGGYVGNTLENKGGFYFGTGLGVRGSGKAAPVISVRYTSYEFNNKTTGTVNQTTSSRTGAVIINFGIAF